MYHEILTEQMPILRIRVYFEKTQIGIKNPTKLIPKKTGDRRKSYNKWINRVKGGEKRPFDSGYPYR